jgi:hypothetical protein
VELERWVGDNLGVSGIIFGGFVNELVADCGGIVFGRKI